MSPWFELERPSRREPTINLSALIDIIFILMIFVILGAHFDRIRAMGVDIPEGDATGAKAPEVVTVQVPMQGPVLVDGVEVPATALIEHLRARRASVPALVLEADRGLALQRAIDLLDAARTAGFTSVSIATRPR